MHSGKIKITIIWEDPIDGLIRYLLEINNDRCSTAIEFYGDINTFKDFDLSLVNFPQSLQDVALLEIGAEESIPKCECYIMLKAYCYEINGHSALHIITDNLAAAPSHNRSEFYIIMPVASLNKLGLLLNEWNPKKQKELIWEAETVL